MTKQDDLLDVLRSARPVEDQDWADSARGRAVMARALSMAPPRQASPSRTRHRLLLGGAAAAALTAVGGTAVAVVLMQADSPTQAGCYSALSASADTTEASADLVAKVGALEACRRTWADTGEAVDTDNPVSCVNEFGGRGVFPAPAGMSPEAACAEIGWQPDLG